MDKYSYQVTRVEPQFNVMEVVYTADGFDPILVGMPIPLQGESLEDRIAQYAPVTQWLNSANNYADIPVGQVGEMGQERVHEILIPTLANAQRARKFYIHAIRDELLNAGVAFDGHQYNSSPDSIMRLSSYVASVNAGNALPDQFTWRTVTNVDVPFDAAQLGELLGAMTSFTNAVWKTSWSKKAQIDAATSIAEVDAIIWGDPLLGA